MTTNISTGHPRTLYNILNVYMPYKLLKSTIKFLKASSWRFFLGGGHHRYQNCVSQAAFNVHCLYLLISWMFASQSKHFWKKSLVLCCTTRHHFIQYFNKMNQRLKLLKKLRKQQLSCKMEQPKGENRHTERPWDNDNLTVPNEPW